MSSMVEVVVVEFYGTSATMGRGGLAHSTP